ncbi:MAG: hypothetical protein ACI8YP_003435 [Algoriphagus sp.]|jgi:hypothetical protein
MNPQRISFLFGLCWFIGFIAFTSFSPRNDSRNGLTGTETFLNQDQAHQVDIRISSELPKTPPFKVDWSLSYRLNTPWISEQIHFSLPSTFIFSKIHLSL